MTDEEERMEESPLDELQEILEQPEERIFPMLFASKKEDIQKKDAERSKLFEIAQSLFKDIEHLGKMYQRLDAKKDGKDKDDDDEEEAAPLSGLPQLYNPTDGVIDSETLWGQVELQNSALHKMMKKSIKSLAKSQDKIVMIDMGAISSDEEEESDGEEVPDGAKEDESDGDHESDDVEGSDDEDEDEETKRVKARMARVMDDMDDDDDDDDDNQYNNSDEDEASDKGKSKKAEEDLYDPVAEDMKDGFFDLHEMEGFADEEEEYLPDEALGVSDQKEKKEKKKEKKTFHQMQRDGDLLNQSDDEDNEDDIDMYENIETVHRKKYRKDDEIDALYNLYEQGSSGRDADDAADMTAADFFGKPRKELIDRYKKTAVKRAKEEVKGDDDSWGEYDFEEEEENAEWGQTDNRKKKGPDAEDDDGEASDADADDDGEEESSDEEEDGMEESEKKERRPIDTSKHGIQTEKLRKQTEEFEKEMLAEKPWQMKGETKGTSRPVNSLLEATPEFEMASKQAPTITVEHTTNLEDVIKKRVLAEDWDDVVPRELPDVGWHKKRGELPEVSQEKSKLGLGELYEREYLKKAVGYDVDAAEKQSEEDKAKDEMKQLFANLCSKLDGLSNYHFAPRPIADEAEVRAVTAPAIAMEEVLPLHVSNARGVAPEEVYATKRGREGILRGDNEMDQNERKRLRGAKKNARRKARKEKLADEKLISRLEPGLGLNNPYEKRKMREELEVARARGKVTTGEQDMDGKYGSSGTFFKRLQAEAQQTINEKSGSAGDKKEKKSKPKSSSFKL